MMIAPWVDYSITGWEGEAVSRAPQGEGFAGTRGLGTGQADGADPEREDRMFQVWKEFISEVSMEEQTPQSPVCEEKGKIS